MLPPGPFLARQQLSEVWLGIQASLGPGYENQYGLINRLPRAKALVRMLRRRFDRGRVPLRYASTLAGVRRQSVSYVIGNGSRTTKIEVATIGLDGKRYVLRARVAPNQDVTIGPG